MWLVYRIVIFKLIMYMSQGLACACNKQKKSINISCLFFKNSFEVLISLVFITSEIKFLIFFLFCRYGIWHWNSCGQGSELVVGGPGRRWRSSWDCGRNRSWGKCCQGAPTVCPSAVGQRLQEYVQGGLRIAVRSEDLRHVCFRFVDWFIIYVTI